MLYTEVPEHRRARFVFKSLISKLHEFVSETKYVVSYCPSPSIHDRLSWHAPPVFLIRYHSITTEEWRSGVEFLTLMGETSITRGRQFSQFSDVFGVTALVERINNPRVGNATESTLLGPFFTEDAPDRA
jgi:hypothetical protein